MKLYDDYNDIVYQTKADAIEHIKKYIDYDYLEEIYPNCKDEYPKITKRITLKQLNIWMDLMGGDAELKKLSEIKKERDYKKRKGLENENN